MTRSGPNVAFRTLLSAVLTFALGQPAHAADASRLGGELTPAGAEKSGNKDGSIPVWSGNEVQQSGWSHGKLRGDHFKYKADNPVVTIDASNADKYADKLSAGQLTMLKQIKGYRMDFPSTTCARPSTRWPMAGSER